MKRRIDLESVGFDEAATKNIVELDFTAHASLLASMCTESQLVRSNKCAPDDITPGSEMNPPPPPAPIPSNSYMHLLRRPTDGITPVDKRARIDLLNGSSHGPRQSASIAGLLNELSCSKPPINAALQLPQAASVCDTDSILSHQAERHYSTLSASVIAAMLQNERFVGSGPRPSTLPVPLRTSYGLVYKEVGRELKISLVRASRTELSSLAVAAVLF